jgi:hypothetical protein
MQCSNHAQQRKDLTCHKMYLTAERKCMLIHHVCPKNSIVCWTLGTESQNKFWRRHHTTPCFCIYHIIRWEFLLILHILLLSVFNHMEHSYFKKVKVIVYMLSVLIQIILTTFHLFLTLLILTVFRTLKYICCLLM